MFGTCHADPRAAAVVVLSCLPWLALLVWLASLAWFMTDDAFITFRYVRNLLEGHGLVFNPGERVEGYSNFLWALELAAIWKLFGLAPEAVAQWLSVGYTVGVLAVLVWWVRRDAGLAHRGLALWMVMGLVCGSATFAVWTSGGGLETRQFTFFVVAAMVGLMLHHGSRRGLLTASFCLAGAALTRPEGVLLALCCFGWFGVQRMVAGWATAPVSGRMSYRRLVAWVEWREVACLAGPFVVLVGAHVLFRLAYYGEWLPNTYYAKHVRPWYESGFRYYLAAALETGLYLLVPLALVALREGWRARREVTYALPVLCIIVHAAGVMRVGGDHFEYRPLDFYWPALSVPAVAGILSLGSWLCGAVSLRKLVPSRAGLAGRACAFAIFVPVFFYASAIQGALLLEGSKVRGYSTLMHFELDEGNASWLLAAPGMSVLVPMSNELRRRAVGQLVALRFAEHREYAKKQIGMWGPYGNMERDLFPDDALSERGNIGVSCYYLPDLKFVDLGGLTDATIARNPVERPNHERIMAHDRRVPPGYLEERGVNLRVGSAVTSKSQALQRADFAVKAGPGLWMPLRSSDHGWIIERFSEHGLVQRAQRLVVDEDGIDGNRLRVDGEVYTGPPVIRSDFNVYLIGNRIVYKKEQCRREDAGIRFFLHVVPVDPSALIEPVGYHGFHDLDLSIWRDRGIEHFDFAFDDIGRWLGNTCVAILDLPEYDIARIRTGQYVPGGPVLWEDRMRLDVDAGWIAGVVERHEPVIRSDFNVYHDGHRLLYTGDECGDEDLASPFLLHIFPEDEDDLPADHQEYGYHILDFRFEARRLPLDFHFKDAPAPGGVGCAAVVDLPGYEMARIRSGQYVPGESWLWHGEFEVGGRKTP